MSTETVVDKSESDVQSSIINDFSIQIATINGSGSQSSNSVLMRAIFEMGIPVSGKNLFPSNIQGLPTWFTIRASKHSYIARKRDVDLLIAMNPQTAREDVKSLNPGAAVVYEQSLGLDKVRDDLIFYPVPFAELAKDVIHEPRLRKLLANMIYVGVVGHLLSIEREEIQHAISKQFKAKAKAVELNVKAIDVGFEYAKKNLKKADAVRVERMDETAGKILIDGNAAGALGSMFNGVTVVTWYPITPSSSLVESLIHYMKEYRIDKETGKATFAVVQAEDELAAIGMVLGAGWAGARSLTSTSGPGISLMSEFVGLGYFGRDPGRHLGHPTCGAVHGTTDAYGAGRHSQHALAFPRRHQTHLAVPVLGSGMFRVRRHVLRFGGAIPDPGFRHVRPRSGHEHLDVRPVRLSGTADRPG